MARLVRVREIWEQREKARVASALALARTTRTAAEVASEHHQTALGSAATYGPITSFVAQTATHDALELARAEAVHAGLQAEATRGVWRRAKQDLEIVERLQERRRLVARAEQARAETKALDELAAIRHGRRA
jgi:flagellar export protein FliJ